MKASNGLAQVIAHHESERSLICDPSMTVKSGFAGIADNRSVRLGRPPGKNSDLNSIPVTVNLRKDVHKTVRKILLDDGGQFRNLVNELVSRWIDS